MEHTELDIGGAGPSARQTPRLAALGALDRLLRAQAALSEQRDPEGPHGLLRPGRDDELDLVEAVFLHCGVPLPETLRAIYRRTLGIGNPVADLPVLAAPFLRAALPGEGHGLGPAIVGLEALEKGLGIHRDEAALDRPPFLAVGHAELVGLTVSRNGLWSLGDYRDRHGPPPLPDFEMVFETAFCAFADQVLLLWANDVAGAVVRPGDLDLRRGARLEAMPTVLRDAMAHLLAPRSLGAAGRGDVQPLDHADLLRRTRRSDGGEAPWLPGPGIAVVGLPYGDYPRVASRIQPGTLLRLQPVHDNPYDENAVEVWYDGDDPARVGFVERRNAPHVAALPQGASAWRLRVVERSESVLYARLEAPPVQDEGGSSGRSPSEEDLSLFPQGVDSAR